MAGLVEGLALEAQVLFLLLVPAYPVHLKCGMHSYPVKCSASCLLSGWARRLNPLLSKCSSANT